MYRFSAMLNIPMTASISSQKPRNITRFRFIGRAAAASIAAAVTYPSVKCTDCGILAKHVVNPTVENAPSASSQVRCAKIVVLLTPMKMDGCALYLCFCGQWGNPTTTTVFSPVLGVFLRVLLIFRMSLSLLNFTTLNKIPQFSMTLQKILCKQKSFS